MKSCPHGRRRDLRNTVIGDRRAKPKERPPTGGTAGEMPATVPRGPAPSAEGPAASHQLEDGPDKGVGLGPGRRVPKSSIHRSATRPDQKDCCVNSFREVVRKGSTQWPAGLQARRCSAESPNRASVARTLPTSPLEGPRGKQAGRRTEKSWKTLRTEERNAGAPLVEEKIMPRPQDEIGLQGRVLRRSSKCVLYS